MFRTRFPYHLYVWQAPDVPPAAFKNEVHGMIRFTMSLALMLLLTPPLLPQNPDNPDAPPNPELQRQEIINLEHEMASAIRLNNATFFRRVFTDDFIGTLSHGQTVNKQELIEQVQNSGSSYQSFEASDITVRIFRSTAIATCLWSSRGTYRGQRVDTQMRTMHVYINASRGWHVIASETTALPPYAPHAL
jgi:ketosteroid isomerase-like protein